MVSRSQQMHPPHASTRTCADGQQYIAILAATAALLAHTSLCDDCKPVPVRDHAARGLTAKIRPQANEEPHRLAGKRCTARHPQQGVSLQTQGMDVAEFVTQ